MPTYLITHYFWVYLWGYFWVRVTSESVEKSRLPSPVWAGLIQLVEGLNRTKGWRKEEFSVSLPDCLWPGTLVCSCLHIQTQTGTYTISSPGSPACWLQSLELLSLHNHEPVPYNKSLYVYIYIYCFCGKSRLIHSSCYTDAFFSFFTTQLKHNLLSQAFPESLTSPLSYPLSHLPFPSSFFLDL